MGLLKSIETHIVYRYVDALRQEEIKSCEEFLDSKWNYKQLSNPNFNIKNTKALFRFLSKRKMKFKKYISKNQGLTLKPLKIYEYEAFNVVYDGNYKPENINLADQKKLNNLKTVLKKMIEQFIVISLSISPQKKVNFMDSLMESLYGRLTGRREKLDYFRKLNFKIFTEEVEKQSYTRANAKLNTRKLITTQHFYELAISNEGKFSRVLLKAMEEDFLINFVQHLCTVRSSTYTFDVPSVDLEEFNYLDNLIEKSPDEVEIRMYYKILNLLSKADKSSTAYYDCFKYFVSNTFYLHDARQFFGFLFVFLNHEILKGNSIYISARILLIKYVIKEEIIAIKSALFSRYFFAVVRYFLQERINITWINEFIFKMQDSLLFSAEYKETLDRIVDAHAYFAERKFNAAALKLDQISREEMESSSAEGFALFVLRIKLNYELGLDLGHQSFLAKLRFLKKNNRQMSRSGTVLESYINFCIAIRRLDTLRLKEDFYLSEKTLVEINELIIKNPIRERTWLIEKLSELNSRTEGQHNFYCECESCESLT